MPISRCSQVWQSYSCAPIGLIPCCPSAVPWVINAIIIPVTRDIRVASRTCRHWQTPRQQAHRQHQSQKFFPACASHVLCLPNKFCSAGWPRRRRYAAAISTPGLPAETNKAVQENFPTPQTRTRFPKEYQKTPRAFL